MEEVDAFYGQIECSFKKYQQEDMDFDEFETALHTSAMEKVFSFVMEAANKSEAQLFMTTHSLEAVDKLLESAGENIDRLRIIRLRKKTVRFIRT